MKSEGYHEYIIYVLYIGPTYMISYIYDSMYVGPIWRYRTRFGIRGTGHCDKAVASLGVLQQRWSQPPLHLAVTYLVM